MLSTTAAETENRRINRMSLTLPIRVESQVKGAVSWNEITRLNDVSALSAGFNLRRPVRRGRLLQLTTPLPRKLRCFDFTELQYKVWGLVRSCITKSSNAVSETHAVGVAFIRVKSEQYNVSIISVVRGRRIAPDGIPRLHIEFVDRFFPLEGIE